VLLSPCVAPRLLDYMPGGVVESFSSLENVVALHMLMLVQCTQQNAAGTDVQTAESGQSREELQLLVQQLRAEVGALRTELDRVKSDRAGQRPPDQAAAPPALTIEGKPGEKVSSRTLEAAIKWPSAGSKCAPSTNTELHLPLQTAPEHSMTAGCNACMHM
jgi:hypothetical protein